jgi:hypothetical protein
MDPNYRATDENWRDVGAFASDTKACLLELRARVEALEAAQQPDHLPDATEMVNTGWQNMADGSPIMEPAPPAQQPPQSVPPAEIFPVEYADSDGDGIRILMEPADETGRVCWVVRNSRHVNPCHEFPSPEDAYAAHRRAQPAPAPPAPAEGLVRRMAMAIGQDGEPDNWSGEARAAIREVVRWLRSQLISRAVADRLEQEAER